MKQYKKLLEAITMMGEALTAIGNDGSNKPIKLLVSNLVEKFNIDGNDVALFKYAVENEDWDLTKLTEKVTGMDTDDIDDFMSTEEDESKEV